MAQGLPDHQPLTNPAAPLNDFVFNVTQTDVFMKQISIQATDEEDAKAQLQKLLPDIDLSVSRNTLESSTHDYVLNQATLS